MARAPDLDFQAFVAGRRAGALAALPTRQRAYAYALDRQSREAFERTRPVVMAVEASVRLFKRLGQHQLLGNAVRVGERQFPRIHRIARAAADTLGIAPPQVFVVNNPTLNAATFGTDDDSFLVVHSALVDGYSDEELLTVLGHECGHIHNSHVTYLTALHYLTYMAGVFVPWILQPALVALRAWSRRAEVTCDRAAMLVVRDRAAAERAIAKLAVGSPKLFAEFDLEAFLEQHAEGVAGIGKLVEIFATHPWLPKRVLAMRVFAESVLYQQALAGSPTGGPTPVAGATLGAAPGANGLTMDEVDTRVAALLRGTA
jgi:Zn-dependent protease with chaperone function